MVSKKALNFNSGPPRILQMELGEMSFIFDGKVAFHTRHSEGQATARNVSDYEIEAALAAPDKVEHEGFSETGCPKCKVIKALPSGGSLHVILVSWKESYKILTVYKRFRS